MTTRDDDTNDMFGDELDEAALCRHIDDMVAVDHQHWPQRLVELIDIITDCLQRKHQVDKSVASKQAADVTVEISRYFGGRQVYIPLNDKLERAIRDKNIYNECKAGNIEALATKYKLSTVAIYKIYNRQRALHLRRIQPRLFEE